MPVGSVASGRKKKAPTLLRSTVRVGGCDVHLFGISHNEIRWDNASQRADSVTKNLKEKNLSNEAKRNFFKNNDSFLFSIFLPELTPYLRKVKRIFLERGMEQMFFEKPEIERIDIEMRNRKEGITIEKGLEKIAFNSDNVYWKERFVQLMKDEVDKIDLLNKSGGLEVEGMRTAGHKTTERLDEELIEQYKRHAGFLIKNPLTVSYGPKEEFSDARVMDLRDAYMAEKLSYYARLFPELHVITGAFHTRNIARFLENEKQRRGVINFFKGEVPDSYAELLKFRRRMLQRISLST